MNVIQKCLLISPLIAGLCGSCAAVPPSLLVQARDAYGTASSGPAAQLTPTELYDARKALDKANEYYQARGDTPVVRDFAYVALRKVELAEARARTEIDRQKITEATKQGIAERDDQVRTSEALLAQSREQLRQERRVDDAAMGELRAEKDAQGRELRQTAAQLSEAQQARETAESRLSLAMKDLAMIAAVKEEARGLVITLSGSVLFASDRFELLETAQASLNQVAEALKSENQDRMIVVEGHTDSRGSDAVNRPLSQNRANAVREYLISRGVEASRISAVGLGATRPLVDNHTAENRANNRRVEIILQPSISLSGR